MTAATHVQAYSPAGRRRGSINLGSEQLGGSEQVFSSQTQARSDQHARSCRLLCRCNARVDKPAHSRFLLLLRQVAWCTWTQGRLMQLGPCTPMSLECSAGMHMAIGPQVWQQCVLPGCRKTVVCQVSDAPRYVPCLCLMIVWRTLSASRTLVTDWRCSPASLQSNNSVC